MGLGRFKQQSLGIVIDDASVTLMDIHQRLRRKEMRIYQKKEAKYLFGREVDPFQKQDLSETMLDEMLLFFKWFLNEYSFSRLSLEVVLPEHKHSFWRLFFLKHLKVKQVSFLSPLDCVMALHQDQDIHGLVYLSQGLGQTALQVKMKTYFSSQIGYGYYLTRAIKHLLVQKKELLVSSETATEVWKKFQLKSLPEQVTIKGLDNQQEWQHYLLLTEDLVPLFQQAFTPFRAELEHLARLSQQWSRTTPYFWLYGEEYMPGFIQDWLKQTLPFEVTFLAQIKMIEGLEKCLEN